MDKRIFFKKVSDNVTEWQLQLLFFQFKFYQTVKTVLKATARCLLAMWLKQASAKQSSTQNFVKLLTDEIRVIIPFFELFEYIKINQIKVEVKNLLLYSLI